MEPRSFYVSYEKFSKIYLIYPVVFAIIAWGDMQVMESLILTIVLTLLGIWGSKKLFYKLVRPRTAITVTDTALETYKLDGSVLAIPFTELLGPFEDKCGPIKRFKFVSNQDSSGKDATRLIIITNMTEDFDELIALISQKMQGTEAGRQ